MVFRSSGGPLVLVAHGSREISQQIGAVLCDAGFSPLRAPHGRDALRIIDRWNPVAAVLDVGLAEVMSFQVIEHIRSTEELEGTKVVLVASVYSRTAYKRRPTSLYGADDYVEQHHIPDLLADKLCEHLGMAAPSAAGDESERRRMIKDGETRTDLSGSARVRTLAHSIVADIALYNEAELHEVVRDGDISCLEGALAEGRRILAERVNVNQDEELGDGDPVLDAFQRLVEDLRRGER
ncbi:MAG: hypothetical protein V3T05_13410 [Myxococcota bacterium]